MRESNIESVLDFLMARFSAETNRLFDEAVVRAKKLMMRGYSRSEAIKQVKKEIMNEEKVFKAMFNRQGQIIRPLSQDITNEPIKEWTEEHKDEDLYWTLGYAHKHCSDCKKLSKMEPRTIEEWKKLGYGLPREGKTQCSYGCNCLLSKKRP